MAKVSVGVFNNPNGHPTVVCGEQNIVNHLNELFDGTGEEPFTLNDVRVITAYHQSRWFKNNGDEEGYNFGPGWPSSMYYHNFYITQVSEETSNV